MSARPVLQSVVLAGVLATAGCSGCSGCGKPPAADTPKVETPAPPPEAAPRKPLTETERLLIGKWKLIKRTPPHNPGYDATDEYRADGTFTLRINNPLRHGERVMTGTYRVQGDLLLRTWASGYPAHNLLIESVTEDRLIYSGAVEDGQQVFEHVRVREK